MHHLLGAESAGGYARSAAAAVAFASSGNAIAEVGAGDRAFNTFCAARSVALSGTDGHVKSARLRGIQLGSLLARALQAVGIAEASGLNFLHRGVHRWCNRTSRKISGMQQLRTRSAGSHLDLRRSESIDHNLGRFDHRLRPRLRRTSCGTTNFGCSKTGAGGSSLTLQSASL